MGSCSEIDRMVASKSFAFMEYYKRGAGHTINNIDWIAFVGMDRLNFFMYEKLGLTRELR